MLTIYKLFPVLFFCFVDTDLNRKDKYDLFFTIIIAESVILTVLLFQLFKEDKINRICKYLNIENEEESNNMYKSESEIMKKYPQSENEQCAICLQVLYQRKKNKYHTINRFCNPKKIYSKRIFLLHFLESHLIY